MIEIPAELKIKFDEFHSRRESPEIIKNKRLRALKIYLEFCQKSQLPYVQEKSLSTFLENLKKQPSEEIELAKEAVEIYFFLYKQKYGLQKGQKPRRSNHFPAPLPISRVQSESWADEISKLGEIIQTKHYSPKTLKTYRQWVLKFMHFTKSKPTSELDSEDVKSFLTFLAVVERVAASTQNQAFNSLLFFYRNVLNREFGKLDGVTRAKRRPYIPVVLSRKEIDRIIANSAPPFDLLIKLLYGCGLRLFECLNLRINSFNLEDGILTVHDGKGKKDRTVPLPKSIMGEIDAQMINLTHLHRKDLKNNFTGTFLFDSMQKKYVSAAKSLTWQWFFPAPNLTEIPDINEKRRYHIHERTVQKAIKKAVEDAGILKKATAHTFRHSFASHLLQANYDIRTIQELLGHSDVKTTMIYTHTIKSQTQKAASSPLDF